VLRTAACAARNGLKKCAAARYISGVGIIEDILKALDRIPVWKRLQGLPAEHEALARRIGALEEKLGEHWPGDVCRSCGARAAHVVHSHTEKGGIVCEAWECKECMYRDFRYHKLASR
jgi:hypothetical protein